ncbi:hypothetical protein H6761_03205 [Candidatus Nomurabacteria bacterium]|nr:hypothetical protein [Candidatus Nomurabacteria bacterium]
MNNQENQSFRLVRANDPWALSPTYEEVHSFRLVLSWKDRHLQNSDYWLLISFCSAGAFLLIWAVGKNNLF